MEAVLMKTEKSKTNKPPEFKLALADKRNPIDPNKSMALANLSIYYTWKKH